MTLFRSDFSVSIFWASAVSNGNGEGDDFLRAQVSSDSCTDPKSLATGRVSNCPSQPRDRLLCLKPRPACWSAAGGGATALPPGEFTCAKPAPESTPTSACDPITAIDFRVAALNGNWLPALFSSTIDSSAIFCASSNPLKTSTTRR
jgi:hypothetical protein